MARLETCGFEWQHYSTVTGADESPNFVAPTALPLVETTTVRSGAAAMKINAATQYGRWNVTAALTSTYFLRAYMRFDGTPNQVVRVLNALVTNTTAVSVRMGTGVTTLGLYDTNNAQVGSLSSALSANQWYRVELKIKVVTATTGIAELLIDGTSIASTATGNFGTTALNNFRVGQNGANAPGANFIFDDVALNDDTGASQTSWPDSGKVVFLKPISDNARVGWTTVANATTSLYTQVDNTPPVPATEYVKDANNNATDTYDANLTTYSTAGIGSNDRFVVTQALAQFISSGATARLGGVVQYSNPPPTAGTGTEGTVSVSSTAALAARDVVSYVPSPTLGSSPVVRIRKGTASTDTLQCYLIGLYVEYVPQLTSTPSDSVTATDSIALALTLALSDSVTASDAINIEDDLVFGDSVTASDSVTLTLGLNPADSVTATDAAPTFDIAMALADSVTPADQVNIEDDLVFGDSVTVSDSITVELSTSVDLADTATAADSFAFDVATVLSDSASVSEAASLAISLTLAESVTASDAVSLEPNVVVDDTVSTSDAQTLAPNVGIADSVFANEAFTFDIALGIADSVTATEDIITGSSFDLSDTATATDSIALALTLNLADAVSVSDQLSVEDDLVLGDSVTASDSVMKAAGVGISDTVSASEGRTLDIAAARADSVAASDATAFEVSMALADSVTPTESFGVEWSLSFDETVTTSDSVSRAPQIAIDETVTASDSTAFAIGAVLTDTVSVSDSLSRNATVALTDAVTVSESFVIQWNVDLADSVTTTDSRVSAVSMVLADTVTTFDATTHDGRLLGPGHREPTDPGRLVVTGAGSISRSDVGTIGSGSPGHREPTNPGG
jgi:hypothetical protein